MRILCLLITLSAITASAQCDPSETSLSMNVYTDGWGYETYWELVPGENTCGDQTIAWGSNIENVGCAGGGQQDAGNTESSYPNYSVVAVDPICLITGQTYTLHFVDDWGDGGLTFELFQDGSLFAIYQGTGANTTWTFQAGINQLGSHDSPCNAMEIQPEVGNAIELNNSNCFAQINEIAPFLGHCQADGAWCYDEVQHSVWAKFTVPDDGAYEISTVHHGTNFNTQVAVWYAEDCSDQSSFILLAANDDYWGDSDLPNCAANPPSCVDPNSAAYLNVIQTFPSCCENGWDVDCQTMYDALTTTCTSPNPCAITLKGFDSYGDGWNECQIAVAINGTTSLYTIASGSFEEWVLPISEGDQIELSFLAGNWPEEVSIQLLDPFGQMLYEGPMLNLTTNFFTTTASCIAIPLANPNASRTYVHCLPAGITCYIQIDGYSNATGEIVLSVVPYVDEPQIMIEKTDLACPLSIGIPSSAYIVTHVEGWGLNHNALWSGPNDYSSQDFHIGELNPGVFELNLSDECQHVIQTTVEIMGPDPFEISTVTNPSCPELSDGSIEAQVSGGTAPYSLTWEFPDGSFHDDNSLADLSSGLYFLHITDANACTIAAPAEVEALPSPIFQLGNDLLVCDNFAIQLEGPELATSYNWSNGSEEATLILTHLDYPLGMYQIGLMVTNSFGCSYSDTLQLTVESCIDVIETNDSAVIYPNPANQHVTIEGYYSELIMYNALGQVVWRDKLGAFQTVCDVQAFESGWYCIQQINETGIRTTPLLIQH